MKYCEHSPDGFQNEHDTFHFNEFQHNLISEYWIKSSKYIFRVTLVSGWFINTNNKSQTNKQTKCNKSKFDLAKDGVNAVFSGL